MAKQAKRSTRRVNTGPIGDELRQAYDNAKETVDQVAKSDVATVAKRLEASEKTVYSRCKLVDPEEGYSRKELDDLIRRARKTDYRIGVSIINELLRLPKGDERQRIETLAIENGWRFRKLQREVRATLDAGSQREDRRQGRRPTITDEADALDRLSEAAETFRRLAEAAKSEKVLAPAVRERVNATVKCMNVMRDSIDRRRKRLAEES